MMAAGTIVFATDDSDEGIEDARDWIRGQQFTTEDVKLVKRGNQCLVIAKRAVKPISLMTAL
jgi:hypothetical protein